MRWQGRLLTLVIGWATEVYSGRLMLARGVQDSRKRAKLMLARGQLSKHTCQGGLGACPPRIFGGISDHLKLISLRPFSAGPHCLFT